MARTTSAIETSGYLRASKKFTKSPCFFFEKSKSSVRTHRCFFSTKCTFVSRLQRLRIRFFKRNSIKIKHHKPYTCSEHGQTFIRLASFRQTQTTFYAYRINKNFTTRKRIKRAL